MAGSFTETLQQHSTVRALRLAWTCDASGAVNGTRTTAFVSGEILRVVFVPGTGGAQPTNLYDVTLEDTDGVDVLDGCGANRSNAAAVSTAPEIGAAATGQRTAVSSTLELKVSNAGNAKQGTVVLYHR